MQHDTQFDAAQLRALVDACADIARSTARTLIMPSFRGLTHKRVYTKTTQHDLVTDVDRRAEEQISEALHKLAPHALIVGEEASAQRPSLVQQIATAPFAFTVDPIDGTINFVEGVPAFGVMIAVVSHGVPIASVILNPVSDVASMACIGQGAWQRDASGRQAPLNYAKMPSVGSKLRGKVSWSALSQKDDTRANALMNGFERLWDFRCASIEYQMAASGHAHVLCYRETMPWDHCPGWILLREAGGYGACVDGQPYRAGVPAAGLLYAPNQAIWSKVASNLDLARRFDA